MSLPSPTKEESAWMDSISRLGCIVCLLQGHPGTPAEVHHMLSGGRRIGHLWTLPLCCPGHHRYGDGVKKISRHNWKSQFEAAYGTESELLKRTQRLVAEQKECIA